MTKKTIINRNTVSKNAPDSPTPPRKSSPTTADKGKTRFLFKEKFNSIRDSVTESRAPIHDIEGKEIIREEPILGLEKHTESEIAKAFPLAEWEDKKQRFNSKFWIPLQIKKEMDKKGKISHDLLDKLYDFRDRFIQSYESDSKIQDTVKPSVKVFDFIKSSWREGLSPDELKDIQLKVEEMTYMFKDTSFLENTPQLKSIFFKGQSAKDFLLESLVDERELQIVRASPTWGFEPGVIWVLSKHFNVFSLEKRGVLLATLIDDLDKEARKYMKTLEVGDMVNKGEKGSGELKDRKKRAQGVNPPETHDERKDDGQTMVDREPPITRDNIHGSKRKEPNNQEQKSELKPDQLFTIGRILLNWLLNKELVCIYQADADIQKGDKEGYILKPSYVRALFDIKLLPLNVTLPMVCPPIEWKIRRPIGSNPDQADQKQKTRQGELTGGYLYSVSKFGVGPSKGASLLSTRDESKFDIILHGDDETRQLTRVLNKLQGVPCRVNGLFLRKIREDWDQLQKYGLVMPKILDSIDRREGLRRLHEHFMKDVDIKENFCYTQL